MSKREYKSSVFTMLEEEPEYALDTYNALNGTNYTDPSIVKIQKLGGKILLSVRNDACIEEGLLSDFFRRRRAEVLNMAMYDFTFERREKLIARDSREEGRMEGRAEGALLKLVKQVCKKYDKGLSVAETADMLEEDAELVGELYKLAGKYSPDYDYNKMCEEYGVSDAAGRVHKTGERVHSLVRQPPFLL